MKRGILSVLLILLLSFSLFSSADSIHEFTRSFTIQAGRSEFSTLVITPISSQTENYRIGMPFNIEEDIVAYHPDDVGRRIATIDIISNTRFRLEISSNGEMKHEEEGKKTGEPLHYILTLEFLLGFYEGGHINESSTTSIRHESRSGQPTYWTISSSPDPDTFLGTVDGAIYFMFDEKSSAFIDSSDDTTLPPGNYKSTVTIRVEAIE